VTVDLLLGLDLGTGGPAPLAFRFDQLADVIGPDAGVAWPSNRTVTKTRVLLIAEAMQAVDHLERAEAWAADVDPGIVEDMIRVHSRLLGQIEALRASRTGEHRPGPPPRPERSSRV
jgi:hypothetical protein